MFMYMVLPETYTSDFSFQIFIIQPLLLKQRILALFIFLTKIYYSRQTSVSATYIKVNPNLL